MGTTLSKGYKQPEIDDKDFWDQINFDIQRLNDHTHDGINSQKVVPGAIDPYAELVEIADWVGGSAPYYYDVLFPLPLDMVWADGDPCPVQVVVRDSSENQVFLDSTRAPGGLGVRVFTFVKDDYLVGLY